MAIGTAAALLGGAALSAVASNSAAKKSAAAVSNAANAGAEAQDEALQFRREVYADQLALAEPVIDARDNALRRMETNIANRHGRPRTTQAFTYGADDLAADPGYQFRRQQGVEALENALAARGTRLGGDALKSLMEYGDGLASQEYGAAYDRAYAADADLYNRKMAEYGDYRNSLSQLAGLGTQGAQQVQAAGNQMGNALSTYAANTGNLAMQGANAQAGAYMGGANALTGFMNNAATIGGSAYGALPANSDGSWKVNWTGF